MRDREIDEILKQAARAPHDVDPALLDRLARSFGSSLRAVRPLPPAWVLAGGLVLVCAAVALAGAARLGFYGVQKLSYWERALLFPALAVFIWLAATMFVREMIPGRRRLVTPRFLMWAGSAALL